MPIFSDPDVVCGNCSAPLGLVDGFPRCPRCEQPKELYVVSDRPDGTWILFTVEADSPLAALDAYAIAEGFAPYSEVSKAEPELAPYAMPGRPNVLGACFANYEIFAMPCSEPAFANPFDSETAR